MPVQHGADNSPLAFYWNIPPVTRSVVSILLATKLATVLGVFPIQLTYLSWTLVVKHLQIWRLITNFMVLPASGFEFLIHIVWTVQYGKILESSTFMNRTADFLWMLIFGGASMLVLTLVPLFRAYFLASSLTEMLLYVWSRNYPTAQVSIMGFVNVQAFYLPFVYVGLAVLLGSDWRPSVIGILAGHLYYYLTTIYPARGQSVVVTPEWLRRLVYRASVSRGGQPQEAAAVHNPAAPGFRPFSGAGRRLA